MSPASLTMKANTFGHDCDKLVQLWKGNCELEVAKQNCFRVIKDHLQQLSFLPKLPNTGDVKEFLSQLKQPSTANSLPFRGQVTKPITVKWSIMKFNDQFIKINLSAK